MIQIYTDPLLLDFIKVACQLPQDEIEQLEAFTGEPFEIDGCAVGNFCAPGPKWVIKDGADPIIVGGFVPQRPGVWRDFLLTTPQAWEKHGFGVTRICRRMMDAMFESGQAHRLECVTLASRTKAMKWFRVLGYEAEGNLIGYGANGQMAVSFSRVKV
jgi:RimJ/RimL family protein N-acetyltransferase